MAPKSRGRITAPEETVYGLRAGLAVFAVRPRDIRSVATSDEAPVSLIEPLLLWARESAVPWKHLRGEEMTRFATSRHHEGLCLRTSPRRWLSPDELVIPLKGSAGLGIAFDRVRNPYNVGAILRTAAFFGVGAALFGAQAPHPALAEDAVRVAEGGAEYVQMARSTDLVTSLARLRQKGVRVVGAESSAGGNLFKYVSKPPEILVFGHEREGLSDRIQAECDALVGIPGQGNVASLNVSVAASIFLAELAGKKIAGHAKRPPAEPK